MGTLTLGSVGQAGTGAAVEAVPEVQDRDSATAVGAEKVRPSAPNWAGCPFDREVLGQQGFVGRVAERQFEAAGNSLQSDDG